MKEIPLKNEMVTPAKPLVAGNCVVRDACRVTSRSDDRQAVNPIEKLVSRLQHKQNKPFKVMIQ
jgi:hypothetical protein